MKRVITITMDIDKSTHTMKVFLDIQEDGKKKEQWTEAEAISTARAMIGSADNLLEGLVGKLIEQEDASAKAEERRTNNDLENG